LHETLDRLLAGKDVCVVRTALAMCVADTVVDEALEAPTPADAYAYLENSGTRGKDYFVTGRRNETKNPPSC